MHVTIKAIDTLHDSRIHVGGVGGSLHRGQTATVSVDAARELEKAGLVEIVNSPSAASDAEARREADKQERLKAEAKQMPTPDNKMLSGRKTK